MLQKGDYYLFLASYSALNHRACSWYHLITLY